MKKRILSIITVLVLVLSIIFILSGCTKSINLENYITISVEGVNGYGKADVSIDWTKLNADFAGKKGKKNNENYYMGYYTLADVISFDESYTLSKSNHLSNGDEIILTWDIDPAEYKATFDVKVFCKEIRYKVKGLKDIDKFDAFSSINVSFEGVEPYGTVNITCGENSPLASYDFTIDKKNNLSNGDVIKLTVSESAIERCIETRGAVPSVGEREYTVTNLKKYITKVTDINEESLNKMKQQATDTHKSITSSWISPDSCKGLNFIGTYILSAKDMDREYTKNRLFLVYKVDVTTETQSFSYYWYLNYDNVTVLSDGSATIDYLKYSYPQGRFWGSSEESFVKDDLQYGGFESIDSLYNYCVSKNADRYICENTLR